MRQYLLYLRLITCLLNGMALTPFARPTASIHVFTWFASAPKDRRSTSEQLLPLCRSHLFADVTPIITTIITLLLERPRSEAVAMQPQGSYGAQEAYGTTQTASGVDQQGYGTTGVQQVYGQATPTALASDQQSKLAQIIAQVNTAGL